MNSVNVYMACTLMLGTYLRHKCTQINYYHYILLLFQHYLTSQYTLDIA